MKIIRHKFTETILEILSLYFGEKAESVLVNSELLQYLNIKTKSANRGSKSRAGFANHYAIYVLVEDYIANGFDNGKDYTAYDGAQYSNLFKRQRELPFGGKLQNHAFNNRLNGEFKKYFPQSEHLPILRDTSTNKYWINTNLINVPVSGDVVSIAQPVIQIIDSYIEARSSAFSDFMVQCQALMKISESDTESAMNFIRWTPATTV
jgi:hypothetical protein